MGLVICRFVGLIVLMFLAPFFPPAAWIVAGILICGPLVACVGLIAALVEYEKQCKAMSHRWRQFI